jgi:hypothetical protein
VADRGINSALNLKGIRDKGYNYIVASRIKNLKKGLKEKIFTDDGYITTGKEKILLNIKLLITLTNSSMKSRSIS